MDLPFNTVTQFVALALTLLAGWLFGMASAPRTSKWRQRYHAEVDQNAGDRQRSEDKLRKANQRIRELETENRRLRTLAGEAPAIQPRRDSDEARRA